MIVLEQVTERRAGMAKTRILNIVATECPPKDDAKFNKWYNEVHIPLFLKYKGLKRVTRYRTIEAPGAKPRYLAIYEVDTKEDLNGMFASPEFKAAREEMEETWKGHMFDVKWAISCEPIKTWEK
jgi:uncharacterized protein (TIGR02118 family)